MRFLGALVVGLSILLAGAGLGYVDIKLERKRARTAILVELLRDDPAQTAHLMLQAHDIGVLVLKDHERDGAVAVVDRELRATAAEAEGVGDAGGLTPPTGGAAAPGALAAALDSPDWSTRVEAVETIAARARSDPRTTEAMIAELEERGPEDMSTVGRHAIIFMLDGQRPASWNDDLRRRCVDALRRIQERALLPPGTRNMADNLSARLTAALG